MAESAVEKGAETVAEDVKTQEDHADMQHNFKAIVLGATGATGKYLVGELLSSKHFQEITLLGRRKFTEIPENFNIDLEKEESSGHLKQVVIDLEEANEENSLKYFEGMDAYFTCFGTTRASAGGNENFRNIDYGYNVKFGEMANKAGIRFCSLLSSSGAQPRSYVFYLKVKGQIEEAFTKMNFPFLTIFRPGILDRKQHMRFLEKFVGLFMTRMPVDTLAKAIVADGLMQLKRDKSEEHRSHILANHQILDLARTYIKENEPAAESDAGAAPEAPNETATGPAGTNEEPKPASEEAKLGEGTPEVPKNAENEVDKAEDSVAGIEAGKATGEEGKEVKQEESSDKPAEQIAEKEGGEQ